jgi:large subunit ribosomal protein L18
MPRIDKNEVRMRVHKRIRRRVLGTAERPRLAVYRSLAHIYAQIIDDRSGHTLASASSIDKTAGIDGGNVAGAKEIGRIVAERA